MESKALKPDRNLLLKVAPKERGPVAQPGRAAGS